MVIAGLGAAALLVAGGTVATTPTIREMIELTDLSSVAVSPDGKLVAYRSEIASIVTVPPEGMRTMRRISREPPLPSNISMGPRGAAPKTSDPSGRRSS